MDTRNLFLAAALSGLACAALADQTAPVITAPADKAVTTESSPTPAVGFKVKNKAKPKSLTLEGNCYGVNTCHGATNTCQGKGFEKMTEKACVEKKGIFKRE